MKKENIEVIRKKIVEDAYEDIKIYGLEEGEEQYYKILGTGYGLNFAHCFSMGANNKEIFWERVFGYKIIPNREQANLLEKATGDDYLSIEFYELG